ncbi:hypothetical protein ACFFGR_07750 [Arthrobacter liuii]|uniref:IclR-ED domain-containing protein n=1 Tax=Arthrobacter liuii TaxID=1476996 RepID=A0ABQ2AL32_9MICC|nr:hypothetical protein [Arthrobacter liuii]GGH93387.1 hypothetical protein GCM10007170_14150 [Arthrobacter liuii]
MAGDAKALADSFGLVEDRSGNAIIHGVELEEPFTEGRTPVAAVAVDLMGSLVTRERSAGQRVIEELLARDRAVQYAQGRTQPHSGATQ